MKFYKKVLIGVVGFFVLVLLLNLGLNFWIATQLPKIINEENDSPYHIVYKDLDVSLLNSNIVATDVVMIPKGAKKEAKAKSGIYGKIDRIEVKSFKLWDLLFSDKIRAQSIRITKPTVTFYQSGDKPVNDPKNIRSQVEPFQKVIIVPRVFIDHGNIKIINGDTKTTILKVSNISVKLDGMLVTDEVLERQIPIAFTEYAVSYDSLFYRPNAFYHIRTKKLRANDTTLVIDQIDYIPQFSRQQFVANIPKEKDQFSVTAANLRISNIDWGFKKEQFYFHCKTMKLESVFANIYRPKMPADDLSKKHLYNKQLRDIPYDIRVDELIVKNSVLEYEEEKTFEKGAGELRFSKFNLVARNITSGFGRTKVPDVKIKINCLFMNTSPMKVDWTLNVLDKSDGFNIKGSIIGFPAENLEPFTKPYMNVTAKGMLDQVYFNFTGNDKTASGDFAVEYDDLKFTIFRKNDREKKNKLLTAIASIFVKKDTKERVKNAEVELERIPEKSFFNFLWRSIAEGLKKILI